MSLQNQPKGVPSKGQSNPKYSDDLTDSVAKNSKSRGDHDSDDDSSEEDEAEKVYRSHTRIIKGWNNDRPKKMRQKDYDSWFKTDPEDRNLIHRTIQGFVGKQRAPPPQALDFIESMVLKKPALFTAEDTSAKVAMLEAAKFQLPILFRVIDLLIPEPIPKAIKIKCPKGHTDCPLAIVPEGRRNQCLRNPNPGEPSSIADAGRHERVASEKTADGAIAEVGTKIDHHSCLHDQVDVERVLREDIDLKSILKKALEPAGQAQAQAPCLQSLIVETRFDRGQKENSQIIPLEGFKVLLQLCPDSVFKNAPLAGFTPLQMAVRLYDKESIDYDLLFDVIEALVDRAPSSVFVATEHNKVAKTAYRLLKELKEAKSEQNTRSRSRAEELLKRTCIGFRKETWDAKKGEWKYNNMWAEKKAFLYWNAKSERQFCLNLTGESVMLDKTYIETLIDQSGMRFETVLDFVKLPYWKPEERKAKQKSIHQAVQEPPEDQKRGDDQIVTVEPDPYVTMFEWLWDSKVRKIFTVEVDDDGSEPHTNAAIRESLRGEDPETDPMRDFEIEVWKWKKFDICSETIATAAPNAREVWLYSHGNTAVLRGWACSSGLARLQELTKLTVEIFPQNVNDEEDCRRYEKEFKLSLVTHNPRLHHNIYVINHGYRATLSGTDDPAVKKDGKDGILSPDPETTPKSKDWVNQLKNFKDFMHNLGLPNRPTVKVALLDDGAKLTDLHGKQEGRSFRAGDETYFVGPCEHGTEMARCIRDICPMAELYVGRLDDSRDVENQKFTLSTCHQALQWALDMEVDVISMSWTFERKGNSNDEHEDKFVKLIEKAVASKTVLLFGALPDQGPTVETHQIAPVGLEGVIRIGSATVHGESVSENIHAKPDFLLPGEEHKTQTGEAVRGSSYATAYASGLAAMVLYTLMAHREFEPLDSDDELSKALIKARTVDGMKKIFNRLSQKQPDARTERGAFVRPYITFGQDFKDSEDGKRKILSRIVNDILPRDVLRSLYV